VQAFDVASEENPSFVGEWPSLCFSCLLLLPCHQQSLHATSVSLRQLRSAEKCTQCLQPGITTRP
jgi:hypothetical protein